MPGIRFLLDEDSLGLADAIGRYNLLAEIRIDLSAVGDEDCLPRGTPDADILRWAEEHDRVLITRDHSTMQTWLNAHLEAGRTSPGVFILRRHATIADILNFLVVATAAGTPGEFTNQVEWIP